MREGGNIHTLGLSGLYHIYKHIHTAPRGSYYNFIYIAADGRGSHIPLQLAGADIAEVESEESLPGADVQRVVFFAEVLRGEVDNSAHREAPGRPLLGVCAEEKGGERERVKDCSESEEDSIKDVNSNKSHRKLVRQQKAESHLNMLMSTAGRTKVGLYCIYICDIHSVSCTNYKAECCFRLQPRINSVCSVKLQVKELFHQRVKL